MSNAIQWAKSNPLTLICFLLIVLAAVSFLWPTGSMKNRLLARAEQTAGQIQQIRSLLRRNHPLPIVPEDGPDSFQGPIRHKDIEELQRIFEKMASGYQNLYKNILAINRLGPLDEQGKPLSPHVELVPGLFPVIPDAKRFTARLNYRQALLDLYQALKAGMPPTAKQITDELARVESDYRGSILVVTGDLSAQQKKDLAQRKVKRHREMILDQAQGLMVYGLPPVFEGAQPSTGFFDVGKWALEGTKPTDAQVWEGQMNLWIQQDICNAIRLTNLGPGPDGKPYNSVLQAPVKHILAIRIDPLYVGVPPSGLGGYKTSDQDQTPAPDQLRPAFFESQTGRRCNDLYDVRRATVQLIIDPARIPDLFDWFGRINFITPIVQSIKKVDKVKAFSEGYYYGPGEVVELTILLESIWMRRWTAGQNPQQAIDDYLASHPDDQNFRQMDQAQQLNFLKQNKLFDVGLMPDVIRYYLGLPTLDPNFAATANPQAVTPG